MPIEGISMTTVFSLITVGIALSLSVYIGGYYLRPSFDISSVMTGVAYDIAAMYEIAYTLPDEVTINYYGPTACLWNYNQHGDSAESFHCYSGEAVLINDVVIGTETILVTNDPYMEYDYSYNNEEYSLPPESFYQVRPSFLTISIPYYDAQLCPFSLDSFSYCALAYAPFAGSYSDIDLLTADTPYSVAVNDYSFVVSKQNVGNYYNTLDAEPSNPDNLITFLNVLSVFYSQACNRGNFMQAEEIFSYNNGIGGAKLVSDFNEPDADYVQLLAGYRWRIYDESVICQERIIVNDTITEGYYVPSYCFDINSITARNPCNSVNSIIFSDDFRQLVNEGYTYYASQSSCLKPYFLFADGDVLITGSNAFYNFYQGVCADA